jgi:hypothetical protein
MNRFLDLAIDVAIDVLLPPEHANMDYDRDEQAGDTAPVAARTVRFGQDGRRLVHKGRRALRRAETLIAAARRDLAKGEQLLARGERVLRTGKAGVAMASTFAAAPPPPTHRTTRDCSGKKSPEDRMPETSTGR